VQVSVLVKVGGLSVAHCSNFGILFQGRDAPEARLQDCDELKWLHVHTNPNLVIRVWVTGHLIMSPGELQGSNEMTSMDGSFFVSSLHGLDLNVMQNTSCGMLSLNELFPIVACSRSMNYFQSQGSTIAGSLSSRIRMQRSRHSNSVVEVYTHASTKRSWR
jgi:hypothetical protein